MVMDLDSSQSLGFNLSANLPANCRFNVHHLSTPPAPCPALYSAPPGQSPEKTFCESHFLSISVASANHPIQVFAVEVLIYTTEYLTTLFVSKADSTGYLYLLNLPHGTPSPFRTIASTFLAFLIENRRRPATKLVLSLFARAQDQYLFPGSIENPRKHVLTDRGLIKWWCQVADLILSPNTTARIGTVLEKQPTKDNPAGYRSQAFLRVPGCDLYETRAFFPSEKLKNPSFSGRWKASDPLRILARSDTLPERCLIPRFPDDPKARFVDELDDELPKPPSETVTTSSIDQNSDRWRSVRSLEEFWEMMAFRQECSAGRLVGFLWVLIVPDESSQSVGDVASPSQESLISTLETNGAASTPPSQEHGSDNTNFEGALTLNIKADDPSSSLPSLSSLPSVAEQKPPSNDLPSTHNSTVKSTAKGKPQSATPIYKPFPLKDLPERTKYYYWPIAGRGAAVLREKDYRRIGKLLIHLDYADEKIAAESTERWIQEVAVASGDPNWGTVVHGRRESRLVDRSVGTSNASMLDIGLLKKKKRKNDGEESLVGQENGKSNGVNVLSLDHIRKKPKNLDGSKE